MKKLFFLIIILLLNTQTAAEDLLYVEFIGDTVKIWNNAQLNCCSLYKFETEITEGKIKLIEIDTSKELCRCICNFNLCASLTDLKPGNYKVEVFRNLPMAYPPDSLFYVGSLEFNYSPRLLFNSYQSECNSLSLSESSNGNDQINDKDSLYVEFSFDTVKVWNINAVDQCCAKFKINVEISNGLIKLTEIDTSGAACDCICRFNLCGIIVGLKSGKYIVEVYRSNYFVGSVEFEYQQPLPLPSLSKSFQSECLGTNPNEVTVYSNSFESLQDTIGWDGYLDFRSDVSAEGGKQSAYISGGCDWPHAWKELGPFNIDGYFKLRCWGKRILNDGVVFIQTGEIYNDEVTIQLISNNWTNYESIDSLFCPAGQKIILAMASGGIIPGAMLIDNIEVIKINQVTTSIETSDINSINSYKLFQNFPNPFNPRTVINYQLPVNSRVTLKVYDLLGNEAATLVDEEQPAGNYEVEFDGSKLSSGIYFYILKAGENRLSKKMCLIK